VCMREVLDFKDSKGRATGESKFTFGAYTHGVVVNVGQRSGENKDVGGSTWTS